ncbi:hypothetical protein QPK87_01000 [Kamptonema cortianum]|uniref:Uncharacterized protein n=2 Tax=Cyanophyceae TaxID=3028117 RepID=A0ACD5GRC7_9CYAN|nr:MULTISPECIES: hypothetical protein [Desertifilum]MCD8485910.1 hypothetical protein [Desertifilum sp.]MDI9635884.1 hypothetical protein [Geitlerinema splendidum]MDK3155166.1 hypothetical protein [Kamptonema cortianum]MBD2321126.1 hypothetical protein [Desertifilum sp. FACHB-866]MBD2331565.1 hypothetical protein [Desertifilum sp. FACHB-868]
MVTGVTAIASISADLEKLLPEQAPMSLDILWHGWAIALAIQVLLN